MRELIIVLGWLLGAVWAEGRVQMALQPLFETKDLHIYSSVGE
jgi:hypothetical protein